MVNISSYLIPKFSKSVQNPYFPTLPIPRLPLRYRRIIINEDSGSVEVKDSLFRNPNDRMTQRHQVAFYSHIPERTFLSIIVVKET